MKELIRTEVDTFNRLYWIMSGETMEPLTGTRHECPVLSIYGHCGLSVSCQNCERVK